MTFPDQPPIAPPRLWTFHGGLHLPDEKALSNGTPIAPVALPAHLVIPLQQHIGAPARARVRVGERVGKGQVIGVADGPVSAPVHASSSGTVVAIEGRTLPHPSGLTATCIVVETDGLDIWAPLLPPLTDYDQLDPAMIRERVRWAGVVGLGGAAFPTAIKLGPERRIETLILNGTECEPYITCDDRLMRERAPRILAGARIIRRLLGPGRILIGIEDNKPEAIAAMTAALARADLGVLAQVVALPTLYPSGGERQLIRLLTGQEVPSGGLPAALGILVQNVGTAAAIADAVLLGRPLITRVVTVTGRAVAGPRNLEVPIGTPLGHLVEHCGGYREPPRRLLAGGPMMGVAVPDPRVPLIKGVNCVLALTAAESPDPGPALACIRCGRCAEVCPARLLPQQLYWHARARALDKAQAQHLFDCIECGCCARVCPSHIPLVHYYRFAKNAIWAQAQERRCADQARARHQARVARLQRQEEERQAKLRKKQEALAPAATAGAEADARRALIEAAVARVAAKKASAAAAAETSAS
jgi:Na+-translocating ferredoxin:NAD+ oxidoreductase subunit C